MRPISLYLLLVFAVPAAFCQTNATQAVLLTPSTVRTDAPQHVTSLLPERKTRVGKNRSPINAPMRWESGSRPTCYVISSYLMRRERSNSDATHLVGHTNCLPSRNVELNLATATSTNSH